MAEQHNNSNANSVSHSAGPAAGSFALCSDRVIMPDGERPAAIVIEHGIIQQVVNPSQVPDHITVTDFGQLVISPGVIDTHVHINAPGTDWEGFESATRAAAAGGVTTLIDMPLNSRPVTTTAAALEQKRSTATSNVHVDVGFYGGVVPGNQNQLQRLLAGGVFGLKAFLCDSGLEEFPAAGEAELRAALQILKPLGVPLLAHAELVSTNDAPESHDVRSYPLYQQSRPASFELAAIELLIRLCREYETPVHIVHLATAEALPMIAAAKSEGLPLTIETCPHYLFFSSSDIADGDTRFKCAPPIRDEANRSALCKAVANGLIDTIGSDHSPCPPDLKLLDRGDFQNAWGGIAGLQLTLPVMWTLGRRLGWSTTLLAERLSHAPSKAFGLDQSPAGNKGKISPGFDADLVVWDPNESFTVDAQTLFHRHAVTPYDGLQLTGVVQQTYVRGEVVFDTKREPTHPSPLGTLLPPMPNAIAHHLNSSSQSDRSTALTTCCAALAWVDGMVAHGDFSDDQDVTETAIAQWNRLGESDWLAAFLAHPRIGDANSLRAKFANTLQTASNEQAGVASADEQTIQQLAKLNDEYFEKFGFIFIVCATGKSAAEMLELLQQRLPNDRATELTNAAAEQLKITLLRLQKLPGNEPA